MTETVMRITTGELQRLRIVCKCGTVTEFPLDSLLGGAKFTSCQGCKKVQFQPQAANGCDSFRDLALAFRAFAAEKENYTVEFPINVED